MRRPSLAPLFMLALSCAFGDEPAESADPGAALAGESVSTPSRPHALSAETAGRVVAGLPKFVPPQDASTSTETPGTRELDVPKNAIIRLPNYVVRETKLPKFSQRELLTRKGRIDLALKRHPGLKFGPLAFLNLGVGLAMLAEEEAYQRRLEMADLTDYIRYIETEFPMDPATGKRTAAPSSKQ